MEDHDDICLCFHVPVGKVRRFMERTQPQVPSQLSECLGAGTGCGWCRPFLEKMHRQWACGEAVTLAGDPANYATRRQAWKDRPDQNS